MEAAPLLLAITVGFSHAFEADHLVAVSNIVTGRNSILIAIKDGLFWGLGHTSTILIVGLIFILGKLALNENIFKYLEAGVGMMLIGLGLYRIVYIKKSAKTTHKHLPNGQIIEHKLAYGVGLIHGLAGSGALILSVLTTIEGSLSALFYLAIFGLGSILGMALAAGIFSMPFSVKIMKNKNVKFSLILLSAVLCIFLGTWIVFRNLTI